MGRAPPPLRGREAPGSLPACHSLFAYEPSLEFRAEQRPNRVQRSQQTAASTTIRACEQQQPWCLRVLVLDELVNLLRLDELLPVGCRTLRAVPAPARESCWSALHPLPQDWCRGDRGAAARAQRVPNAARMTARPVPPRYPTTQSKSVWVLTGGAWPALSCRPALAHPSRHSQPTRHTTPAVPPRRICTPPHARAIPPPAAPPVGNDIALALLEERSPDVSDNRAMVAGTLGRMHPRCQQGSWRLYQRGLFLLLGGGAGLPFAEFLHAFGLLRPQPASRARTIGV